MQKSKRILDNGFTLVETLIVLVVIVVSSFVIVNSIKSGMSIFKKARHIKSIEDISVFFDRLRGDLKNVILFSELDFKGDSRSVGFPIIAVRPFKDESSGKIQDIDQIRYVKYRFSQDHHSVYREEFDYSQFVQKKEVPRKTVLSNISDFKIEYFTQNACCRIYNCDYRVRIYRRFYDKIIIKIDTSNCVHLRYNEYG